MTTNRQLKLIRQMDQARHRREAGLFLAEGPKVVGDLLRSGFSPTLILATDEWEFIKDNKDYKGKLYYHFDDVVQRVTPDELRRASLLKTPQQVLALFEIPSFPSAPIAIGELALALDGVQDPGNLGTIIRLADWFGISRIFCSRTTADCWAPKVVQATMGSIARVRVEYCDLLPLLKESPVPVFGTLLDGDDIYAATLPTQKGGIVVMGNEGNGISQEIRQLVTHRLLIPSYHTGPDAPESLNVAIATAIVCAELRRRGI